MFYDVLGGRLRGERWTFTGRKVDVYGAKGGRLRGERWTFTGAKVDVYGAKGGHLRGLSDFYTKGGRLRG